MNQQNKNNIVVGTGFSKLGAVYELRSNLPKVLRWAFDGAILGLVGLLLMFGWVNRFAIASIIGSPSEFYSGKANDATSTSATPSGTDTPGTSTEEPPTSNDSPANQPVNGDGSGGDIIIDPNEDPSVDPNAPPRPPEGEGMPPDPSIGEPPTGSEGL